MARVDVIDKIQTLPRKRFLALPTPLHRLDRLSARLGANIWIKRDDLTGLALGGNKGRKLEFLMGAATALGADYVVGCGAVQSNHARQTAAAAAICGMKCLLILLGGTKDNKNQPENGNLVLQRWLGAEQVFIGAELWEQRDPGMWDYLTSRLNHAAKQLHAKGHRPFIIPIGGSEPVGAVGFVMGAHELKCQIDLMNIPNFENIVTSTSSGGTQTGLSLGCRWFMPSTRVMGICADPEDLRQDMANLSVGVCELLGINDPLRPRDFGFTEQYVGEAYAVPTKECISAIKLLAELEGIFLDPVYSGKAMAGLIDMVRSGKLPKDKPILFWHTGGLPVLFAEEYVGLV